MARKQVTIPAGDFRDHPEKTYFEVAAEHFLSVHNLVLTEDMLVQDEYDLTDPENLVIVAEDGT